MSKITEYNTPEQGQLDWHTPLNENFDAIESDVKHLATEVGISGVGGYNLPEQGTLDWHTPLNENFDAIESDVKQLASEVGVTDVGGYNRPEQGTLDWHIPLNENFTAIYQDLSAIASVVGVTSLSEMKTLSAKDIWFSLVGSGSDTSNLVYDATEFTGTTLAQKFENALSAMRTEVDGCGVLWVPSGSYEWNQTVDVDTGEVRGPMFLFDTGASINVTADWALDIDRSSDGSNLYGLTNDPRNQIHITGGEWTLNGTGLAVSDDIYRGLLTSMTVIGGTHAIWSRSVQDFCEGWSVRDCTFESVDRPLRFTDGSHDQQLLANLTFRDFEKGVHMENTSGQNYTAAELVFEQPRQGAVGLHFTKYTTGTIYHPQWSGSTGTMVHIDGISTNPSIVDPDVNSEAELYKGVQPTVSTDSPQWQKGQLSPVVTNGGPTITTPVQRTDNYSGSLPQQVESAVADLSNGGTVVIPGAASYTWDDTVSFSLDGRDISIVTPGNVRFNVTTSGWTFDVTGDGSLGVYGGWWHGRDDASKPGWLTTTAPNLDVSVKEIIHFPGGSGIDAAPVSKGTYRIFDSRFHDVVASEADQSSNACVQVGGAGCSSLQLSHIETSNTRQCYRFDAPVDDFDGVRLSAHPWHDNAVFAETNASLDGTWFNMKWEAPGRSGTTVFDNNGTDSPAAAVEPWAWAKNQAIELWEGTKPQFFPGMDTRVDTQHVP